MSPISSNSPSLFGSITGRYGDVRERVQWVGCVHKKEIDAMRHEVSDCRAKIQDFLLFRRIESVIAESKVKDALCCSCSTSSSWCWCCCLCQVTSFFNVSFGRPLLLVFISSSSCPAKVGIYPCLQPHSAKANLGDFLRTRTCVCTVHMYVSI